VLGRIFAQRLGRTLLYTTTEGALYASFIGESRHDEHLIRLSDDNSSGDEDILRKEFDLTGREAEVLLWITQGKSNRDVAAILACSPRTVNKHLEQIFQKLRVENRTAAAMLAMRALTKG
jgi:DNA-binding CsgD family transcriptional regulator